MGFIVNISRRDGKTFHIELELENIIGRKINETINGEEIHSDLNGYILKITGLSDKAGFPSLPEEEGFSLRKKLLKYGRGMREKKPKGLRKKKTVRGNIICNETRQINMIVEKEGNKKLEEIFPDQCKPKEKKEENNKNVEEKIENKEEANK
ncbi:MAG: S6e family ribosomal protein [Candidatus Pacearchaeota archaeon]